MGWNHFPLFIYCPYRVNGNHTLKKYVHERILIVMRKWKVLFIIGLLVLMTGCSNNNSKDTDTTKDTKNNSETETEIQTETGTADEKDTEAVSESQTENGTELESKGNLVQQQLEGLIQDEYQDLELTAAILERKAVIGGASVPIAITIKNNGESYVSYIHGSGSFETPEALLVHADKLQVVIPKDQMGLATMDMRAEVLGPGEELSFTAYVKAMEPNENFDTYTYEMYNTDQTYIAEVEWGKLQESFPELVAIETGSYDIQVYFLYTLIDEANGGNSLLGSTGFAKTELTISITD